jgi:hypothetical protein
MLAEWTAECAADAPAIVVPWSDAASGLHFVNLRTDPYAVAEITEAEHYPALSRALRSINAQRSPLLSSKCDVWNIAPDSEEMQALTLELDFFSESPMPPAAMGSYIDLVWRDRALFISAHHQRELLDRLVRRAQRLPHDEAAMACVQRPAVADFATPLEGFAFTLYVRAVGIDAEVAQAHWGAALEEIVALLRGKDLLAARPSATIDGSGSARAGE